MGSTTHSDLIIPLPGESLESHYSGLRKLFDVGVDIIMNNNMRMLPGTEMNSQKTRIKFNFKTRYRLIHGDSGCYKSADGKEIKTFELEESLRATNTMSEDEVFKLREVHFLVEFMWNFQIYSDLLKVAKKFKINQLDLIIKFLEKGKKDLNLQNFWIQFDKASKGEWFNSRKEAEEFFSKKENFENLINQEYEKLNIQFSIVILKDYKKYFDEVLVETIKDFGAVPEYLIKDVSKIVFAQFPPFSAGNIDIKSKINFKNIHKENLDEDKDSTFYNYHFPVSIKQKKIIKILTETKKIAISKILNTQNLSIRSLKRDFIVN